MTLTGVDSNSVVVTESNGDVVLEPDSAEIWPVEIDPAAGNLASLSLEDKAELGSVDLAEDVNMTVERLEEDRAVEQPLEEIHNCDRLSPQCPLEDAESDPAVVKTIFIAPLDGSQAELRTRVIKEVRKPGRSEYEKYSALGYINLVRCRIGYDLTSPVYVFFSDYEAILRLLQQVKGPLNVQRYFIQHAIKEAVR